MSTPVTHRIADRPPIFPCDLIRDDGTGAWFEFDPLDVMRRCTPAMSYTDLGYIAWTSSRPTHAPESQAPSDSEMLDYLDGLTIEQAVAVINSQSKNLPTVRAAIASAMKGGDK